MKDFDDWTEKNISHLEAKYKVQECKCAETKMDEVKKSFRK